MIAKYDFRSRARLCVGVLLILHAVMLARMSYVHTPMYDEIAHLPAGISHWQFGSFELYRVNPPLVRMVASIPVAMSAPAVDWTGTSTDPHSRPEFSIGYVFVGNNGTSSQWMFALARWACIPFSLLGGWVCFRWAKELVGVRAGMIALVLWCFCPTVLAWGGTMTPDATAAALGVTSGYAFWRWLQVPGWRRATIAGLTLGLAELTKSTWIVLFGLWPVMWFVTRMIWTSHVASQEPATNSPNPAISGEGIRTAGHASCCVQANQLAAMLLLAVYLLNAGYGFEGSFQPLGEFEFISGALGGVPENRITGNRFRGSVLENVPVPLPANYVHGIDVQKYDFEVGKWSYLRGEHKRGGWWYYYLYALGVKTPLGTLCLATMAITLAPVSCKYRLPWRDEFVVILPAVAVLVLVSSQTGFNRYIRYVLPALPFLFVSISRVGRAFDSGPIALRIATLVLLASTVVGSLRVFPHSMSYFNLLAGGPRGGPEHLLDANIDWGQDLLFLKRWIERHPEARPFHLQYFGLFDPKVAGVEALPVPLGVSSEITSVDDPSSLGPQPGWHAVSVNDVYGYRHNDQSHGQYMYFQKFEPVDMAGYSIYIYHISIEDANRVRRDLGLPAVASRD